MIIWLLCNIIIIYIVTICTVFTIRTVFTLCTVFTICIVFIICTVFTICTVCALFIYRVAFYCNLLLDAANLLQNAQFAVRVLQTCCKTCGLHNSLTTIYTCRDCTVCGNLRQTATTSQKKNFLM